MAVLVTLTMVPGTLRLKLRTDGHALISRSAPEVIYDQAIRDQFGIEDQIVVVIRSSHPDGIFNPATIQLVRELTAEFGRLATIDPADVISLATEMSFRCRPGTYNFQRLLEPALTNKAELYQLRDDLRRIELYTGTLVSTDGKSTVILVSVPNGANRSQLQGQVQQIIAAHQTAPDEIAMTGAPVAESLLGSQILEDLGVPKVLLGASTLDNARNAEWKPAASLHELRLFAARHIGLVPLAALVMMLIFLLCFRNVLAALLPLPGVVAAMLFVFGLMGWCDVPVYLTTAVMPVLLTVISVTNDIYLFNRYFNLLRENPGRSHVKLVEETFDRLVRPVACTSLTAAIGFLSFGLSPLAPVRAFGLFTGVGALFGLFFSLTVVPALLVWLNPARLRSRRRQEKLTASTSLAAWFSNAGEVVVRRRWWVVGLTLVVMTLTPLGLRRLVVQDSWTNGFDPESEFRRTTLQMNQQFFGMHLLLVSFDAPEVVAGEVAASNLYSGLIILPTNSLTDLALIERSSVTLAVADESPARSATNGPHHAVWQPQIGMAVQRGDRIFAGIDPKAAPGDF